LEADAEAFFLAEPAIRLDSEGVAGFCWGGELEVRKVTLSYY
jgi:hypothetical protein